MSPDLYFGGSFNPPHFAHLKCAAAAGIAAELGRVILVPTGESPLKDQRELAPALDRLAMTQLAVASTRLQIPFSVDDREVRRGGASFTIDTVIALNNEGIRPVNWLIGADQLLNLHRWNEIETLLHRAKFWVMARPGYKINWNIVHPMVTALRDNVVAVPQIDLSATGIRHRARAGESLKGLVPEAVERYIQSHQLYR